MAKQMRAGVKAAWIIGVLGVTGVVITAVFSKNSTSNKSNIQKVNTQKVDTGIINNFNASRDINILYKTPEDTIKASSEKQEIKRANITDKNEASVNSNPSKSEQKNQIINNAPNQGVQINENKGTVVVPKPLPRSFGVNDAKKILEKYPINFPIEIWLKGTTQESKSFFDQVVDAIQKNGYNNFSTTLIGLYASTEVIKKDFQYEIDNGKLVISIFPQQ